MTAADVERIHEMNVAVGRADFGVLTQAVQPDAVWEHNPGTGSPEEGVYRGVDEIRALFERILEGWDYLRPEIEEIREVEPGVYDIRGDLVCKHKATESELRARYTQRLEMQDGLLARARMTVGSTAGTT